MRFDEWEPVYEAILADFGYDRAADERARDVLGRYGPGLDEGGLPSMAGATVGIAGAGPSLSSELDAAARADVVIAASAAADVLLDAGIPVDLMVTDLDKNPGTAAALTRERVPVVVHAHGDNIPAIREWVPRTDRRFVLGTTQARPVPPIRNFGGFTDGDRAAFLADHVGASALRFVGWDFDDPSVDAGKRRKLVWAARLLYWLERRRGDRFAVLDRRRAALDREGFPVG